TTLSVDPGRVAPGGTVTVTATHVPANQIGEIKLWSVVHTYPFRANSNGVVNQDIAVPRETELGNHIVKICWDNSCRKQAPLRVVAGVADASPAAGPPTSPGSSPGSGSTPSPGSTPAPRSTPSSGSTPHPTSTPTSTPTSGPTP